MSIPLSIDLVDLEFVFDSPGILKTVNVLGFEGFLNLPPGRVIGWSSLTPAFNTWISSRFSMFHCICVLFILLILVGVELPLCIVVTLS